MFLAYFLPCIRRTNWIQALNERGIEGEGKEGRCMSFPTVDTYYYYYY